jgi:hypothetical protein
MLSGGPGYWFDGVDDVIISTANIGFESLTDFSLIVSFHADISTAGKVLVGVGGANAVNDYASVGLRTNGNIYWRTTQTTLGYTATRHVTTGEPVSNGNHVIVLTKSGDNDVVIYLDGKLQTTRAAQFDSIAPAAAANDKIYAGIDLGSNAAPYNSTIYSYGFTNLALTAAEVKAFSNGAAIPYKYIGASQTEKVLSTWTNGTGGTYDYDTFDDASTTGFHAINIAGVNRRAPTVDEIVMEKGKRYRASWKRALTSGQAPQLNIRESYTDGSYASTDVIAISSDAEMSIEFTSDITSTCQAYFYNDAATAFTISEFSLTQIGCVLNLEPSGIGHNQWIDNSGNNLTGTVSGALPTNLPVNHREKYLDLTVTDDTTFTVPAGYKISSIILFNTTANAVTGGINIGLSAGAEEVVANFAMGANALVDCTLLQTFFSTTADDVVYVNDVTSWNSASLEMRVQMERIN